MRFSVRDFFCVLVMVPEDSIFDPHKPILLRYFVHRKWADGWFVWNYREGISLSETYSMVPTWLLWLAFIRASSHMYLQDLTVYIGYQGNYTWLCQTLTIVQNSCQVDYYKPPFLSKIGPKSQRKPSSHWVWSKRKMIDWIFKNISVCSWKSKLDGFSKKNRLPSRNFNFLKNFKFQK